jgi:hypothetical protein
VFFLDVSRPVNFGIYSAVKKIKKMDASTTMEVVLSDTNNNFYIKKQYTYGEITICFLLIAILSLKFWELVLKITKKDDI